MCLSSTARQREFSFGGGQKSLPLTSSVMNEPWNGFLTNQEARWQVITGARLPDFLEFGSTFWHDWGTISQREVPAKESALYWQYWTDAFEFQYSIIIYPVTNYRYSYNLIAVREIGEKIISLWLAISVLKEELFKLSLPSVLDECIWVLVLCIIAHQ